MAAIVWKGYLSFGLVSFPIRLYAAGRPEGIHFHMLHRKDLSRVKEVWYCAREDKPIDRDDIVKGYEVNKGEFVVVEGEELKSVAPPTASAMEILQFVRSDEVDPIYFESSYYVASDEKITKPYALFQKALTETHQYGIAKVSMHGREHVVVIRARKDGLVLHTLFYQNELHEANQGGSAMDKVNGKELELAKTLISQLSGPFKPQTFHDTYRENLEHLIEQKQKGRKMEKVPQPRKAPVIDLMEALKRSLKTSGKEKSKTPKKAKAA